MTANTLLELALEKQGAAFRASQAAAASNDPLAVHQAALALEAANDELLHAVHAHERTHPYGVIVEP